MPSSARRPAAARALQRWERWVIGMVAAVLIVQGLAMGLALAQGPRHQHRGADGGSGLVDFRRDVAAAVTHVHRADAPLERHYHAPGDSSMVVSAQDRAADTLGLDEGSAGGQVAVWLGLLPAEQAWNAGNRRHEWVAKPLWPSSTRYAGRLERPPRAA